MQQFEIFNNLLQEYSELETKLRHKDIGLYKDLMSLYMCEFEHNLIKRRDSAENFNPIELLGLRLDEITHSKILAWAFDPFESHNQLDLFFKQFITKLALNVEYNNLDYRVVREYSGMESIIDILVYGEKFVLYIENKTISPEGPNQLNREYQDLLRLAEVKNAHDYYAIFLTPRGAKPENEFWLPLSYNFLGSVFLEALNKVRSEYVKYFFSSWISILKTMEG